MRVYHKCLKWLGTAQIVITAIELVLSLILFASIGKIRDVSLTKVDFLYAFPQYIVDIIAGIVALSLYRKKKAIHLFFRIELALLFLLVIFKVASYFFDVNDTLIDTQLFIILMIMLTIHQMGMEERNLKLIGNTAPSVLDLKLTSGTQWFSPRIIGPHFKLDREISGSIDSFLETQNAPATLEINVHGLSNVSETLQETMREVLREHYEDEIMRTELYLASRFQRALILITLSILVLEIWVSTNGANNVNVTSIILSNIAVFSLWQTGTVYFERKEAHEQLLRATIAKMSTIDFL